MISRTATATDALSTACFVAGAEASLPMLERLPGTHALFIPDAQPLRILVTPGMLPFFTPEPAFAAAVQPLR